MDYFTLRFAFQLAIGSCMTNEKITEPRITAISAIVKGARYCFIRRDIILPHIVCETKLESKHGVAFFAHFLFVFCAFFVRFCFDAKSKTVFFRPNSPFLKLSKHQVLLGSFDTF